MTERKSRTVCYNYILQTQPILYAMYGCEVKTVHMLSHTPTEHELFNNSDVNSTIVPNFHYPNFSSSANGISLDLHIRVMIRV